MIRYWLEMQYEYFRRRISWDEKKGDMQYEIQELFFGTRDVWMSERPGFFSLLLWPAGILMMSCWCIHSWTKKGRKNLSTLNRIFSDMMGARGIATPKLSIVSFFLYKLEKTCNCSCWIAIWMSKWKNRLGSGKQSHAEQVAREKMMKCFLCNKKNKVI